MVSRTRVPFDAIVVGGGPNGLAAAIEIARAGRSVVLYEGAGRPGGGCRSAELTVPGFVHDVCAAFHPLAVASPFFRSMPLDRLGVRFVHPKLPFAHPLDGGRAALSHRSVEDTAAQFGTDRRSYHRVMDPLVRNADALIAEILAPPGLPRHPLVMARFGSKGVLSAAALSRRLFDGDAPRSLLAGAAAHVMVPLDSAPTGAVGLLLCLLAHAVGWPVIEGGSERLIDGLVTYLRELGGVVRSSEPVTSLRGLPSSKAVLFDVSPQQMLTIAGDQLPDRYRTRLSRFRHGPGIFKIDWALDGPVPWTNPRCADAGTVHLGGTLEEMVDSERAPWEGRVPEKPYVLLGQQSACDASRAPAGKQTLWGYCHVPAGSPVDMTDRIEAQVERFAPGFKDRVLARATMAPNELEDYNPNCIGGAITGGVQDLRQTFARPVARFDPHRTPNDRLFICSASASPGGGVHGMSGYHAARSALKGVLA